MIRTFNRTPEELAVIARELEAEMPGWKAIFTKEDCWYFAMQGPNPDWQISVSLRHAPKKYQAYVSFKFIPHSSTISEDDAKDIGTDFQRGPKALAEAIVKRLVPHIEEIYPVLKVKVEEYKKNLLNQKKALSELATMLNYKLSENEDTDRFSPSNHLIKEVSVDSDGLRCVLKLQFGSIPVDKAKLLIQFINDNNIR